MKRPLAPDYHEQLRQAFARDLRAMEDYVGQHGNPNDDWRDMCGAAATTSLSAAADCAFPSFAARQAGIPEERGG